MGWLCGRLFDTQVTGTRGFDLPDVLGFSEPKQHLRYLSTPYPYSTSYSESLVGTFPTTTSGAAGASPLVLQLVAGSAGASLICQWLEHNTCSQEVFGFSEPKQYLCYPSIPSSLPHIYSDSLVGTVSAATSGAACASPLGAGSADACQVTGSHDSIWYGVFGFGWPKHE